MGAANRIVRQINAKAVLPTAKVAATADFNAGDLLYYKPETKTVEKPGAEGDGATFLGISEVTVVDGKLKGPYQGLPVDAAQAAGTIPGPLSGVEALLVLKEGDTVAYGDKVYLDPANGPYHVQASGTKEIGVYTGLATVTASAGQKITVALGSRFPNDTLSI